MQVDYLIVGQGLCGTMLSWFLHKEGRSFLVIDDGNEHSSSKVAAGIINPVTGRRYAYTWMIDEIMPFAVEVYQEMGRYFNVAFIMQKGIIDFFPSPQMRNAFIGRHAENDTYLHAYPDQNHFNQYFQYDFGCGEIRPAYLVQVQSLLSAWRKRLLEWNSFQEGKFDLKELEVHHDGISYAGVSAERIIFCDGVSGIGNPWFSRLPFAPNKGEALLIECEGLTNEHVYKKGLMLAPLSQPHNFWLGSNYQWEFADDQPSKRFYEHGEAVLKGWLKKPFRILSHKAAIRPATIERRPFVGLHPHEERIGLLNGMGTKGTTLAPFFANQLVQHLVHRFPITAEADLKRFMRILAR